MPRISWALTPQAKRKVGVLLGLLLLVVLVVSSNWFWRLLYPIHHEAMIREASAANGLDPLMVAGLIRVESKFKAENVSRVGAMGLMQLMPETAAWIATQSGIPYAGTQDLNDPETNIRLGTWYLAYLREEFQGNDVAAIAAYNGGPGRIKGWITNGKWDGQMETADRIPVGETRHYVQRVFFNYDKYRKIYPDF